MSWTDERVETLKRMWGEGQSASQIARELGGVTRNAVIGKVHRLGLSNRTLAGETPADAAEATPEATVEAAATSTEAEAATESPEARTAAETAADAPEAEADDQEETATAVMLHRRPIITAGQPLPPQPSANEISAEALATVREVEKRARKLTLMELTERTCKWPVGDPATPDFWFCGLPAQAGKPYCEAHVGVAFQPMSARRDRRR